MKISLQKIFARITFGIAMAALLPLPSLYAQSAFVLNGEVLLASVLGQVDPPKEAPQEEEASLVLAKKSKVAPIKLPAGAFRVTGKEQTEALKEALTTFAKKQKRTLDTAEILVWPDGEDVQKAFPDLCEAADYRYQAQPEIEADEGKITLFTCTPKQKDSKQSELFGFWGTNGRALVLTWAVVKSERETAEGEATTPEAPPDPKPTPPSKTAPKKNTRPIQEGGNGKVPAEMLGEWGWTTIGSVNYVNTNTNQLTEPSGMSARFTFSKDGRYQKFFYVRQRTYSLVSESTTTEEGKVTFGDGTFTMTPDKGYYKGHTGSRVIDRPMTKEERKVTTYRWEWRNEGTKRLLFLGPDTQSLRPFKPVK